MFLRTTKEEQEQEEQEEEEEGGRRRSGALSHISIQANINGLVEGNAEGRESPGQAAGLLQS